MTRVTTRSSSARRAARTTAAPWRSAGALLVVTASTWGTASLFSQLTDLHDRLLAELPQDRYRVVALMHPNVWYGHGPRQVRAWRGSAMRRGLALVPPESEWLGAILAADVVIGDAGSTTVYAAAAGVPVVLGTFPDEDVVPGPPPPCWRRRPRGWFRIRSTGHWPTRLTCHRAELSHRSPRGLRPNRVASPEHATADLPDARTTQPPSIPVARPAVLPTRGIQAGGVTMARIVVVGVASLYISAGVAEDFPLEYAPSSVPDWMRAGVAGSAAHIAKVLKRARRRRPAVHAGGKGPGGPCRPGRTAGERALGRGSWMAGGPRLAWRSSPRTAAGWGFPTWPR